MSWLRYHWLFLALLWWQLNCAYFGFYRAYGLLALLLGPVRTWALPLAVWLRSVAMRQNGCQGVDGRRAMHQPLATTLGQQMELSDGREHTHSA